MDSTLLNFAKFNLHYLRKNTWLELRGLHKSFFQQIDYGCLDKPYLKLHSLFNISQRVFHQCCIRGSKIIFFYFLVIRQRSGVLDERG